jgi:hypothetical protein
MSSCEEGEVCVCEEGCECDEHVKVQERMPEGYARSYLEQEITQKVEIQTGDTAADTFIRAEEQTMEPQDRLRFKNIDERKRGNYVFANTAIATSLVDLFEYCLLKCKALDSTNECATLTKLLESPEIRAEFEAMYAERGGNPHWSSTPQVRIVVRCLSQTTRSLCLKERKARFIQEQAEIKRKDELWTQLKAAASEDGYDEGSLRRRPAGKNVTFANRANENDNANANEDAENDNDVEYRRKPGETILGSTNDSMIKMMKTVGCGVQGIGATIQQMQT